MKNYKHPLFYYSPPEAQYVPPTPPRPAPSPSHVALARMSRARMPTTARCLLPCCHIAHALRSCASTSDAARASHIDLSSRRPSGVQQTALTGQRSLQKEEWTKRAQTLELALLRHAAGGSMSHELAPPAQETSFADDTTRNAVIIFHEKLFSPARGPIWYQQ